MSGLFPDDAYDGPAEPAPPRPQRRRALLYTAVILIALFFAFSAFTSIWTDRLWFVSVDYGEVFRTVLVTRAILFVVFGATRNSSFFMQPFPRTAKAGVNLVVSGDRGATWRSPVELSGAYGWAAGFSGGVLPDGTAVLTLDDRSPGYYDRFLVRAR